MLVGTDAISLEKFRVVGNCMRFNDGVRNSLKDARQRIVASLAAGEGVESFLIWGAPGSGKSFFVQELAKSIGPSCDYKEMNLAQLDEASFRDTISKISAKKKTLCFVDEIDAKPTEPWPYEALLPIMERGRSGTRICFVLAGSGVAGLQDLRKRISQRPKGTDMLSRIPADNCLTIPQLEPGDKMVVGIIQLVTAARDKGHNVREVEKLALLYVMESERLSTPRQLRQFTQAAAERIPSGEDRVKYDHLFRAGDPENKEFWLRLVEWHRVLANQFVRVVDLAEQIAPLGSSVQLAPSEAPRVDREGRVAVLPFLSISPEATDDYFADGMTEEMISAISKIGGLRVIARTSVMRYKGKDKSVSEIGKELGVASLLEGSVRKQGSKVRIIVQLVDASSEEPRWSDEYDRDLKDIFEIQRDIGQKVAQALRIRILQGDMSQIRKIPTRKSEAYVQYLRGRQLWNKSTKRDLEGSVRQFEEAIGIDPGYALAHAGIADAYNMLAFFEFLSPAEAYSKAKDSITKALELEPDLVEAHTALAQVKFQYDWDWAGAEEEFRNALKINPGYAPAHRWYADFLKAMGRLDEALVEVGKAEELDPLNLGIGTSLGHVLYLSRRYDAAIDQYRKMVEMDPGYVQTHIWFGRPYLQKGMNQEALSELETALKLGGEGKQALAWLGHALGATGRKAEALQILDKLIERSRSEFVPAYLVAVVYNGLRDGGRTVEWLQKARDERSTWLVFANVEPRFDWLRSDPNFMSIMRSMSFP